MSDTYRANRKAIDADIVRLNSVGLSLATIAFLLGCNSSTVTQRLRALGVRPADTRRAFMEGIYQDLTPDQQAWLERQLGPHISIKDFIKNLIVEKSLGKAQGDRRAA